MPKSTINVRWEGSQLVGHSLALVNREITSRLALLRDLRLSLLPYEKDTLAVESDNRFALLKSLENAPLAGPADIHVRHQWPLQPTPPAEGKWIIIQPWEFGALPLAWEDPMLLGADEVWVPSTYNRECYIACGVPEDIVHVVPNGVHEVMFTPARPFPLKTRKRVKFLFVGGTILRKGIDLLIDAYTHCFTRADDVCLVIKDFGNNSFYQGRTSESIISELQKDPDMPEIEYIREELSFEEMRDLYHAGDVLVHPFRGEGFGLPIAEAMACGTPVIVPDKGGASDFCNTDTAHLIPSQVVPISGNIGERTVRAPWWLQPDKRALRKLMERAVSEPHWLRSKTEAGKNLIGSRFTWDRVAGEAAARIRALAESTEAPRRTRDADLYETRLTMAARAGETGQPSKALSLLQNARTYATEIGSPQLGQIEMAMATQLLVQNDARAADRIAGKAGETLFMAAKTRPADASYPAVRYVGWVFNASGYADEARTYLLGLLRTGWNSIELLPKDAPDFKGLFSRPDYEALVAMTKHRHERLQVDLQHTVPTDVVPLRGRINILRTMFETDRLPYGWAEICNRFHEVWVPSEFNLETFERSGVVSEKIRVMPESIDLTLYDSRRYMPADLPSARAFRFLSVFDWSARKGWDVLLQSYFEEFSAHDDVTLLMKVNNFHNSKSPREFVEEYLKANGYTEERAHFLILDEHLSTEDLIRLYLACDALVMPTRGEGWGRPFMEAMALGKPVIGTRWSGNLAFMNDENSFLIETDGLERADRQGWEHYRGHLWANPSVASCREMMRRVYSNPQLAAAVAARGHKDITENFGQEKVARLYGDTILRLAYDLP